MSWMWMILSLVSAGVWGTHITFTHKIWWGILRYCWVFFLGRVDIIGISGGLAWGNAFHMVI